jgi:hypothetical protein
MCRGSMSKPCYYPTDGHCPVLRTLPVRRYLAPRGITQRGGIGRQWEARGGGGVAMANTSLRQVGVGATHVQMYNERRV